MVPSPEGRAVIGKEPAVGVGTGMGDEHSVGSQLLPNDRSLCMPNTILGRQCRWP